VSGFVVGWLVIRWLVYWLIMVVWLIDYNSSWLMSLHIWVLAFVEYFTFSLIDWLDMMHWLDVVTDWVMVFIIFSVAVLRFRVFTRIEGVLR